MSHNTFSYIIKDGKFYCQSHNFEDCLGEGESQEEAFISMKQKITYIKDNDPNRYKENLKYRVRNGLECMCGQKLNPFDKVIGVVNF